MSRKDRATCMVLQAICLDWKKILDNMDDLDGSERVVNILAAIDKAREYFGTQEFPITEVLYEQRRKKVEK